MMKPQRPTGVSVLAILYLLFGVIALLVGALAASRGSSILSSAGYGSLSGLIAIVGGVAVVVGLFGILVGWGMWSGKGWAWWVALILSALGLIGGLGSLAFGTPSGIVSLVIDGLVIWYLFRPHVKAYFGRSTPAAMAPMSPMSPPPPAPTST
jgi:lysylphosphatidylglycerol synthetase-like protein (DUF2156 family)